MPMDNLSLAQSDMRAGYCSGGPGILVSSLAWLAAGVACIRYSPEQAVWVLFVGGALIAPTSDVICRLLGAAGRHARGNPLGSLAWASTLWLIFSLPLAYAVSLYRIDWFFPAMLLVIGGRYLAFHLLFGLRLYWVLGLTLAATAWLLGARQAAPAVSAFVGGGIEFLFAVVVLVRHRQAVRPALASK